MRLIDFLLVALVAAAGLATAQQFDAADLTRRATPTAAPLPPHAAVRTPSGVVAAPAPGRLWRFIVVHHSGTRRGSATVFARARGGPEALPYHYVVGNGTDSGDGEVELTARGLYHCPGPQCGSEEIDPWALGICVVGNFEETPPTRRQWEAVTDLVRRLARENGIAPQNLIGECEVAPQRTVCPGRRFPLAALRHSLGE